MSILLLSNILDVTTIIVSLIITIRIWLVYPKVRSPRLLVLGLSMGIITLTAVADLISSNIISVAARTDWFLYIGQAVALLYILLSIANGSDTYLQRVVLFQVFSCVLLTCLLLFSFALPDAPSIVVLSIIGSVRFIICIVASFYYLSGFMKQQTRFGFLMSVCFVLLALGYLMDVQQYIIPHYAGFFDGAGDVSRLLGFLALLGAVLGG